MSDIRIPIHSSPIHSLENFSALENRLKSEIQMPISFKNDPWLQPNNIYDDMALNVTMDLD